MILLLLALALPQDTLQFDFTVRTARSIVPVEAAHIPAFDSLTLAGKVTVVLSDTVGGRVARAGIDSATPARTRGPHLDGNHYRVVLRYGEQPSPIFADDTSLSAMQGVPVIGALFPALRPNAAINDRWVDTTEVEHVVAGVRSRGSRITSWHVVDRDEDALLVSGIFAGSATATLDPANTITLAQRGTIRAVIRPGWPADIAEVTDSADVHLTLSGTVLHIRQLTAITLVRRAFRPSGRANSRRRVPN